MLAIIKLPNSTEAISCGAVIICTIIITVIIFSVIAHSFGMAGIFDLKQEKVSQTVPSAKNLREVSHFSGRR